MSEYKRLALEDLRIKASLFFELTKFLSKLMRDDDDYRNSPRLCEFINVSSTIGKGLMEATEIVEMDFERFDKKESETKT